jgi:hypothetical protein
VHDDNVSYSARGIAWTAPARKSPCEEVDFDQHANGGDSYHNFPSPRSGFVAPLSCCDRCHKTHATRHLLLLSAGRARYLKAMSGRANYPRIGSIGAAILGALLAAAALMPIVVSGARACTPGDEACPVVLHMAKGAVSVSARGEVSGTRPNFFFKFNAQSGQKMTLKVVGQNLKTGAGIPITLPNGTSDAVDENAPFSLPQTGDYLLEIHANTMSEGPFGPFTLTLTIR